MQKQEYIRKAIFRSIQMNRETEYLFYRLMIGRILSSAGSINLKLRVTDKIRKYEAGDINAI